MEGEGEREMVSERRRERDVGREGERKRRKKKRERKGESKRDGEREKGREKEDKRESKAKETKRKQAKENSEKMSSKIERTWGGGRRDETNRAYQTDYQSSPKTKSLLNSSKVKLLKVKYIWSTHMESSGVKYRNSNKFH